MTDFFFVILKLSLVSVFVSLVIFIARFLLKGAPRWISCLLWIMLALRLVCPIFPESRLSFVPLFDIENEQVSVTNTLSSQSIQTITTSAGAVNQSGTFDVTAREEDTEHAPKNQTQAQPDFLIIGFYIWASGAFLMLSYGAINYIRMKIRFSDAVLLENNIRQSEKVNSPFVMGFLRPQIYINYKMDSKTKKQVLLHEQAHISRLDHIWKPLGFVLLSFYWFNPFLWISYFLFCKDIEIACDEKVIKNYQMKQKKAYAMALLSCSSHGKVFSATPLAFGEVGVEGRIKKTLKYKKPTFIVLIVAVVIIVVLALCLLTNPANPSKETSQNNTQEHDEPEAIVSESSTEFTSECSEEVTTEPATEIVTEPTTEPPTTPATEAVAESATPESYYDEESYDYDETDNSYDDYDYDYEDLEHLVGGPTINYDKYNNVYGSYTANDILLDNYVYDTSLYTNGSNIDMNRPAYIYASDHMDISFVN